MAGGAALTFSIAAKLDGAGFKDAAEQMRQLQKEVDKTTEKSEVLGEVMKTVAGLFGIAEIGRFYKEAIEKSLEAEINNQKLQLQVENTGKAWEKSGAQVMAFTQALADQSRFENDELNQALGNLIQRTQDVTVSQNNLKLAMGLSVATGKSVAEMAETVGMAAAGNSRGVHMLAREFGIVGENAKDADYVLNNLANRFERLGTDTEKMGGKVTLLKKSFAEFQESIGSGLTPAFEWFLRVATIMTQAMQSLSAAVDGFALAMWDLVHGNIAAMKADLKAGDEALTEMLTLAKKYDEAKASQDADAAGKRRTVQAGLSEELLQLMKDSYKSAADIEATANEDKVVVAQARYMAEVKRVEEMHDFQIASEADKQRVMVALAAKGRAEIMKADQDNMKKRVEMAVQMGNLLGVATAKTIKGEKDAWKGLANSVIDMVVAQVQGMIIANAVAGYAKEVGEKGYVGMLSGLGILAWGAAQSAGVGALGELTKSAIGSESGGPTSAPSGGGGGGEGMATGSAATAAPEARQQSTVRVNIQGDLYGDPAFVDRLAAKISDAVENRDVRLVSNQTVGA